MDLHCELDTICEMIGKKRLVLEFNLICTENWLLFLEYFKTVNTQAWKQNKFRFFSLQDVEEYAKKQVMLFKLHFEVYSYVFLEDSFWIILCKK